MQISSERNVVSEGFEHCFRCFALGVGRGVGGRAGLGKSTVEALVLRIGFWGLLIMLLV